MLQNSGPARCRDHERPVALGTLRSDQASVLVQRRCRRHVGEIPPGEAVRLQERFAERDGATDERRSLAAGPPAVSQPGPFPCQSPMPPTCLVGHVG
jgi:hypothetical protein